MWTTPIRYAPSSIFLSGRSPDDAMPRVAGGVDLVVRTAGAPLGAVDSIRRTLRDMNGEQVVYEIETMDEIISDSLASRRFSMLLAERICGPGACCSPAWAFMA